MRAMKDSGVEWIGEIPEEWRTSRLKFVLESPLQYGANSAGVEYNPTLPRYIRITDITRDCQLTNYGMLSLNRDEAADYILHDKDILLARSGATAGKAFLYRVEYGFSAFAGYLIRARLKKSVILPEYAYYTMQGTGYEQWKHYVATQATIPNIGADKYNEYVLPIPLVSEQKAIVVYLDQWCGEIDKVLAKTRESIEEYKKLKQSVITEAVTKGIRPDRPMKPSGIEWIGDIPKEWEHKKAKYCITVSHGSDPVTAGDIPVYGSGAESFKTCGEYKEGPTVLVGRKGATLHIPHFITTRYWNVDTAFDVKTKSDFDLRFYYYLAQCFDYKLYISQTTLPGMTQSNYLNMVLPAPSLEEQQEIVAYLDQQCAEIDRLIAKKEQIIAELESYKKSLIYECVTGKREVAG